MSAKLLRNNRRKESLAKLTPREDRCWVFAFCFHVDQGRTDSAADRLAWRDLRAEFPMLRNYSGCRA